MKENISIQRIDQQEAVHPDAIHAKAGYLTVKSVVEMAPWETHLRPTDAMELQARPIGLVALDSYREGEEAHIGHAFVKEPQEGYAEVSTVYVDDEYGGQQIGSTLINRATTDTLLAGWTPMAYAANPHAQRAFENAGYRQAEADELPTQPYNPEAVGYIMDPQAEAAHLMVEEYMADDNSDELPFV